MSGNRCFLRKRNKMILEDCTQPCYVLDELIPATDHFPNNDLLPLLVYKGAFALKPEDTESVIINRFKKNGYTNHWVGDVYDYDHFHATTHEVLAVFSGNADILFGGLHCVEVNRGDVMIIPAGVAHKKTKSSDNFQCVAAYPEGHHVDNHRKETTDDGATIAAVAVPAKDPVYGTDPAYMKKYWG